MCASSSKQVGICNLICDATLASELAILGLNPDPAISCQPGGLQAGRLINGYVVPRMYIKLGIPSADISWWKLKIPWCPS